MQRIVHIFRFHCPDQQTDGFYHDNRVRGLNRNHDIGKVFIPADTQKFHTRGNHAFGSVAIAAHDPVGQRTVVHADADGGSVCFADVKKWNETVAYLLQFCGIFLIGIFQQVERLHFVDIVSGVDTHFLHLFGSGVGRTWVEMDVGDQRSRISGFVKLFTDYA